MPPPLALILTVLFTLWVFRYGSKDREVHSWSLWIPSAWMLLLGSRSVSQWLNMTSAQPMADALAEGNPTDRAVYAVLMALAVVVLVRRRVSLVRVFNNNPWIVLFFVYCALSVLWSDFPGIAFRRWTKSLGDPLMALVVLTEKKPAAAIETVLKRCIYIFIPFSILFIKYFPELGRYYDGWTGLPAYTGITTDKNMLGHLCMLAGLYFVCRLVAAQPADPDVDRRVRPSVALGYLAMIAWLFVQTDSKTPLVALVLGIAMLFGLRFQGFRVHLGKFLITSVVAYVVVDLVVDIVPTVTRLLGRDPTFTGRTEIWSMVTSMNDRPLIGSGFESFWLGDRLARLWSMWAFRPNQAHNGYIEIYLNLGIIGLVVLGCMMIVHYRTIRTDLLTPRSKQRSGVDLDFASFRLAFLSSYLLYNYSESAFKSLHLLFIVFLITAIGDTLPVTVALGAGLARRGELRRPQAVKHRERRTSDSQPARSPSLGVTAAASSIVTGRSNELARRMQRKRIITEDHPRRR